MKHIYLYGCILALITLFSERGTITPGFQSLHFNEAASFLSSSSLFNCTETEKLSLCEVATPSGILKAPAPEVNLLGNGVNIVNADNMPALTDHTDFGIACLGGTGIIHTYTIQNTGDDVLNLLNAPTYVTISGPGAGDFTINAVPAGMIAALNGTTSFQVKFAPGSTGTKNAVLTIMNNDADENPFSFSIQGTGVNAPVILTQPSNQVTTSPAGASFTIAANNVTSYQWQVNSGAGWTDVPNGSPYTGTTTATLNINPALGDLDGNIYQCILFSNAPCSDLTSAAAGLTVSPGPCVNDVNGYSGWILSGATFAANQSCSGTGILFNAMGEYAVTPVIVNPLSLNFTRKRSTNSNPWELKVQVSTSSTGPWTDAYSTTSISVSCAATTVDLSAFTGTRYIRFLDNRPVAGGEERGIDDITITCGTSCPAAHSISGFVPLTAPTSAILTITGTNFTNTTAVKFGVVPATNFAVINATTITAEVPANVAADQVVVTKGGCEARSSVLFTPVGTAGACGTNGSTSLVGDLFISEVYDNEEGNLGYVEIFNGTPAPVILGAPNNYVLQVKTGSITNFNLSGTIASGAIFLVKLGDGINCSVAPHFQDNASFGFNGNDEIFLLKNGPGGTVIDYVPNPNFGGASQPGFTQRRKATTTAINLPSGTFTPGDWITSLAEDCSHLGIAPYSLSSPSNVIIYTQPQDVNCTAIIFTVASTGSGPGVNAVLWKYNDPSTMNGWSNVGNLNGTMGLTTSGTNTASMTISGSIAQLLNYQFYAEVQRGSCISSSNAAQYAYDTKPVYTSNVATGNWNVPSSWLMASNAGGPFVPTCTYPTAVNSGEVIIRAYDHISLLTDVDVDRLTIQNMGTLEIGTSGRLRVYDSASGADLVVNGTLMDRGSAGNGIQFGPGATWLLGSTVGNTGTIIKTNTSSVTGYRDNYFGGIPAMAATPSWYFRYNGDGNPNVAAVDMYYPNLFFENTANAGTFGWNTAFTSLDGATSNTVIQGDLNIGTTGTGSVAVYNNNIHSSPLLVKGNLSIAAGSLLTNASYNNITDATHGSGTGIEVKGNLTLNGTLTLNAKDSGLLKMSGTGNQNISGIGTSNLQDVTLNNSSGLIYLNKSISIPGVLTVGPNSRLDLQAGNLTLQSTLKQTARVAPVGSGTVISYTGPGRFVVERFYQPRRAWRLITAPITAEPGRSVFNSWQKGGLISTGEGMYVSGPMAPAGGLDLSPQANYSFYTYNGSSLSGVPNTQDLLLSGTAGLANKPDNFGMFVFVRGDRSSTNLFFPPNAASTTLRDTGKLQVHDQFFNLTNIAGGYSLVGNPFASHVDITGVLSGSTNLVKTRFYAYDPYLNSSQGGYITFTNSGFGFVATPPSPGGLSSIIQSSQAFYVEHTGANANLVFRETDKTTQTTGTTFRPEEEESSSVRINLLVAAKNQPAILADGVLVHFRRSGNNQVDDLDALKFMNNKENLAIARQHKILTVENRAAVNENDTIFLQLKKMNITDYQFVFESFQFDPLVTATLEDHYTGVKTPINLATKVTVDFTVNHDTSSNAADRFMVVLHRVAAALPVNFTSLKALVQGRDVLVKWTVHSEAGMSSYILERCSDGRNFQQLKSIPALNTGEAATTYQWTDLHPDPGEYLYRVRGIDHIGGEELSNIERVTINDEKGIISIDPNPVTGGKIFIRFHKVMRGNYSLVLFDQQGRELASKTLVHKGTNSSETFTPVHQVASGLYRLRVTHPGGEVTWLDAIF